MGAERAVRPRLMATVSARKSELSDGRSDDADGLVVVALNWLNKQLLNTFLLRVDEMAEHYKLCLYCVVYKLT